MALQGRPRVNLWSIYRSASHPSFLTKGGWGVFGRYRSHSGQFLLEIEQERRTIPRTRKCHVRRTRQSGEQVIEVDGREPELLDDEAQAFKRQGELAEAGFVTQLYRYRLIKEPVRWLVPHHMGNSQCSCTFCKGARTSRFKSAPV